MLEWAALWQLVIVACALAGWWLTLRPGAAYAGAGRVVSVLIILIAILLCILALQGQRTRGRLLAAPLGDPLRPPLTTAVWARAE